MGHPHRRPIHTAALSHGSVRSWPFLEESVGFCRRPLLSPLGGLQRLFLTIRFPLQSQLPDRPDGCFPEPLPPQPDAHGHLAETSLILLHFRGWPNWSLPKSRMPACLSLTLRGRPVIKSLEPMCPTSVGSLSPPLVSHILLVASKHCLRNPGYRRSPQ